VNPGENPVCPVGIMLLLTSLEGQGDVGLPMVSANADVIVLDNRNTTANQVTKADKVHLQPISKPVAMYKELGNKSYIPDHLFHSSCALVIVYTTLVEWIDTNWETLWREVETLSRCTQFSYDCSQAKARYCNVIYFGCHRSCW